MHSREELLSPVKMAMAMQAPATAVSLGNGINQEELNRIFTYIICRNIASLYDSISCKAPL
jgi:hypothetical protein